MRVRSWVVGCVGFVALAGCAQWGMTRWAEAGPAPAIEARADGTAVPWTGLAPLDEPEAFSFAVVSDRTGEHREGVFAGAMPKTNLLQPAFVISVGDLIEGYTDDPATLAHEWDELQGYVGALEMPFFYAPGNHDMSNAVMAETWKQRFGPSYYHFRYKGVLFLVLNSELFGMVHDPRKSVPRPWTQDDQLRFAEQVLAANADARWTFVIVHQPLWDAPQIHPDWLQVEEWLGERPYTVFAGHYHRYTQHVRRGRNYVTLATTGGGSELRGEPWGEFDHVALVRMGEKEPVIANVEIDGIHAVDVRPEALRRQVDQMARSVVPLPVVASGARFSEGVAVFEIANPLDRPLEVEARVESGHDLTAGAGAYARTVPAGGVERLEIPVRAVPPRALEDLSALAVHFTVRADAPGKGPVELELERSILPERPFSVAKAGAIATDGDLAEWGPLRFRVDRPAEVEGHGAYEGAADASFRFDVRQDDERVVLAVQVIDDSHVSSSEKIAREQDGVQISLDARPRDERNVNAGLFEMLRSGALRRMVTPMITVATPRPDPILQLFTGGAADPTTKAARATDDGYAVEVSIPHAVLDEHAGGRWDGARINITVADFDADESDSVRLSWRASRFGPAAPVGSGAFAR